MLLLENIDPQHSHLFPVNLKVATALAVLVDARIVVRRAVGALLARLAAAVHLREGRGSSWILSGEPQQGGGGPPPTSGRRDLFRHSHKGGPAPR